MDSNAKNLPLVSDGRVAFIDTEHWDRSTRKSYLHHVGEYLSTERRKLAKKFFDLLEDGEAAEVGAQEIEEDARTSSSSS